MDSTKRPGAVRPIGKIALALLAIGALAGADRPAAPRVRVDQATLTGLALPGGVSAWLGIRYAVPPVGERRWHVSRLSHLTGAIDATHYGAACPQGDYTNRWYRRMAVAMGSDADAVGPGPKFDEDCLFLNVWAPPKRAGPGAPVIVWIHGGSNTSGYSQEADYRGAALAARGAVVVTINYRLGALGFLAHPALADPSAGRQGLSDQITALRWIRAHIAAFGGDPARVTVAGESAGGTDIAALMHMPVAKGLFARAIIESGYLGPHALATPASAAHTAATLFGTNPPPAAMSAAEIARLRDDKLKSEFLAPLVDAKAAFRVPLLIGSNADEYRLYLPPDPAVRSEQEAAALSRLPHPDQVAHMLMQVADDPARRADLVGAIPAFHCPAVRAAAAAPAAWVYRFDRARPGNHGFGAYHGTEIPYVFGTTPAWMPADPADRALSDMVMRYWINFAAKGDPNGPGLPAWPRWPAGKADPAKVPMMHFATRPHLAPSPDLALCPLIIEP